jgi:GNAT superfamily N-acetyltransferase
MKPPPADEANSGYNIPMASITVSARGEAHPNLRPLNVLRDLSAVADLIEICFSSTMDNDGRQYLQDMRKVGKDNSFTRWANHAIETTSLPLSGYIWEENGRIVGNASLIPFKHKKKRVYLIANVAVHPDYRRRGIALALMERSMNHVREKRVGDAWLHVRDDNPGAIDLYRQLGFVERARRTSWQARTDPHIPTPPPNISITGRRPADWQTQLDWLSRLYPEFLAWHRDWSFKSLRPGFWNWLHLFLMDINIRQWAAFEKGKMEAALSWIPYGRGESLFAAAGEGTDPNALTALLFQAKRELNHTYSSIALEFPAGRFDDAIRAAEFKPVRTLIWMQATL